MVIFWDWNGTLLDDFFTGPLILNQMLAKRHLPTLTDEQYYEIFDFPVISYYRQLFDLEAESFETIAADYITAYDKLADTIPLRAGFADLLVSLKQAGHKQYILSASDTALVTRQCTRLGVSPDGIYGHGNGYAYGKEELGRRAMAELGVAPENCLLIGDTVHDSEVAHAMGIRCLLVTGGHHNKKRLAATGNPVADTPQDIITYIRRLYQ